MLLYACSAVGDCALAQHCFIKSVQADPNVCKPSPTDSFSLVCFYAEIRGLRQLIMSQTNMSLVFQCQRVSRIIVLIIIKR